jgi:hypothetical protein
LRHILGAGALVLLSAGLAAAEPIAIIETGPDGTLPEAYAVLDIRDEDTCLAGSPANSRCLPAELLLYSDGGEPLGFHALRWALGTLGLSGAETLVIYPGGTVSRDDALAAAALLRLAGQAEVLLHEGPAQETRDGARVRGLWRDVIYTAPMRTGEMRVAEAPEGSLHDRLKTYATGGDAVVFAAGT